MTAHPASPRRAATLALLGTLLVSGTIVVWVQRTDAERERERVEAVTRDQARSLVEVVDRSLTVAYALGALVRQGGGEIPDFEEVAEELLAYFPSISVLALSPDGVIRQTVPFEANRASLGFDQFADPVQGEEARRARDSARLTVAGPLELVQGGLGVVGRLPVFLDGSEGGRMAGEEPAFWGLVNVVLPVDRIVAESGLPGLSTWELAWELWRPDPNTGVRQVIAGEGAVALERAVSTEVRLPNGTWTLSALPAPGWGAATGLFLRGSGALLISLLASWVAHLLATLGMHRRRLEEEVETRTAEIREAQGQLEATLAAIPDLLFEVDGEARILGVHARSDDLLLAPKRALLGTRVNDWLPPDAVTTIEQALRDAEAHGWSVGRQYALEMNGEARWFELSLARKTTDPGRPPTFIVLVRDVTARRAAAEALRESEARYVQVRKMESVGRLAGGVAHDFNNLLTVIRAAADLAAESLPPDDAVQEELAQIRSSAERGAALTQQLLGTSSQQMVRPERLELNEVVTEFLDMVRRMIGTDVQVSTALSPGPAWIRADRNQLSQVFLNLAANARDAMPRGGTLVIRTALEDRLPPGLAAATPGEDTGAAAAVPTRPWVRLAFQDSGEGMTPEVRERVFEPFFTTKARGRGSGLGLATVYGIVRQIGGDITVESEPDAGTCFHLWFPGDPGREPASIPGSGGSIPALYRRHGVPPTAVNADAAADADATGGAVDPAPGPERRPRRILLVDDEPAILRLARRALERAGYEVRTAARGEDALGLLEGEDAFEPDALVTDVVMPGMNGVELALRIRKSRSIPVLFTSGFADHPVLREEGLPAGATFIPKPYEAASLLRELARLLDDRPQEPTEASSGGVSSPRAPVDGAP